MTVAAITGHRPERVSNWQFVETQLKHAFHDLKINRIIVGMAEGVDIFAAEVAHDMNIPYWAYRPWHTHGDGSLRYEAILRRAHYVKEIRPDDKYPGPWVYHERNRAMVDDANIVIAVWDGYKSGGTYQTVLYANSIAVPVVWINPKEGTVETITTPIV